MRIADCFPSKYLKAGDLPSAQFTRHTIASVAVENLGEGAEAEMKPIVFFAGQPKGLCLNRTNGNIIAEAYGEETDLWRGRDLLLYVSETLFQGRTVPCIRVKVPDGTKTGGPAAVASQGPALQAAGAAPASRPGVTAEDLASLVADWRKQHPDIAGDREAFLAWARATLQVNLPMGALADWTPARLAVCRQALTPGESGGDSIPF